MREDPDHDIRTTLLDAGGWAERHATLPGPARARRRARTRSAATVLAAAGASVLVVIGTIVGVTAWDGGDPPIPAAPTVVAPTPSPTADLPPTVPTTIPDDIDLDDGVPQGAEFTTETVAELPTDVCPDEGIPGIDQALDRRFLLTTGPEFGEGRGLLVFADADAAVAFMTGFQAAVDACAGGVPRADGGSREILQEDLPGAWATGTTLLLIDVPAPGGDPQPTFGSFLFAVRTGSAVLLVSRSGEYLLFEPPHKIDPSVVAIDRRPVDLLARQLCRWTVAGC